MSLSTNPVFLARMKAAVNYLTDAIKQEWDDQGHNATGKTIETLEVKYQFDGNSIIISGFGSKVLAIHDNGVTPERMVIGWKRWQQVAYDWAKTIKPTASNAEINRFLYFTWRKHKQEGMPTRGAYAYSKNNRRTEWTKNAVFSTNVISDLVEIIDLGSIFQKQIDEAVALFNSRRVG